MKSLTIGYQPLSVDLSHAGDRRRLAFWAKCRGHRITTDLSEAVDVVVLSERANFHKFPKKAMGVPTVFDLVDGYLSKESIVSDWARGTVKILTGQLGGTPKPFTSFVKNLCEKVDAVVCSSPEQSEMVKLYSKNVHHILDSHSELPLTPFSHNQFRTQRRVIWEGMAATIAGIRQLDEVLYQIDKKNSLGATFVVNEKYFRLLGKYFSTETLPLLRSNLPKFEGEVRLVDWTPSNLVSHASNCDLALIPTNLDSPIQNLKAENRLLIMWRLGLPCLTSASPAYQRVANISQVDSVCRASNDWLDKITNILSDPLLAEDHVRRGQSYVHEYHNDDLLLAKWDSVFDSVS